MLDILVHDVRHALRGLWQAKGFSLAAVLTLTTAIGGTVSVFSLVDGVLLKPLPYPQADRLVAIHEVPLERTTLPAAPVNAAHFREWRARNQAFAELALVAPLTATLSEDGHASRIQGARVSPSLFALLGVRPALGRLLRDDEDVAGRDQIVVLTDQLWRERLGADPDIVGHTVRIDDVPFEVVGILPSAFRFPKLPLLVPVPMSGDAPLFFKPFAVQPNELRLDGAFNHIALGRLRPGVNREMARAELQAITAGLTSTAGAEPFGAQVVDLHEQLIGHLRAPLQLVLGAAVFVLTIACVNVANLLFARGLRRRHELSVKRATGAGSTRLIGQALAEGLTLSALAGVLGVGLGATLLRATLAFVPLGLPGTEVIGLDGRALLIVVALSGLTGVLTTILPAWIVLSTSPSDSLRQVSRAVTPGRSVQRVRSLLVLTEIAVSTVCLAASGLLLHSFVKLMHDERGFKSQNVLTATINLTQQRYPTSAAQIAFYDALVERARQLPGATGAGIVDRLPVNGTISNSALAPQGTVLPRAKRPLVRIQLADAGYFDAMSIPLTVGRLFQPSDRQRRTALVSARAAREIWPGEDAVGKRFRFGPDDSPLIEVVGIVGDVQAVALGEVPPLSVYVPYWLLTLPQMSLAVATDENPATATAIRDLIRAMDADLAVPTVQSMERLVDTSVDARRFQMMLVLILGLVALTLAGVGVYAVLSQAIAQRVPEIGLRMAIGATPDVIQSMVLRRALWPVIGGFTAGALGSSLLRPFIEGSLFRVGFVDATTYAAVLAFVVSVALVASYLPARRAASLDPLVALRAE